MNVNEIFAERVYELRLTHKSISTIESALRTTSFEKLVLLAKFFDVSTDYLLGLKDEP